MTDKKAERAASRQPRLPPADLSDAQRTLYEAITTGPRRDGLVALTDDEGVLLGPFGGFLLSPPIGEALQNLGAALRYRSRFPARIRELAILAVAAHHDSAFERSAHEAVGRSVGLSEAEMASIGHGSTPELSDPEEQAALRLTTSLLTGDVDDETWNACVHLLGVGLAYELIVLVGYYSMLALQMRVLRTDQPPQQSHPKWVASSGREEFEL